jgi:hypothetical protein
MSAAKQDRDVAAWLRRLNWALGALPARDREEILAETAAHLDEATAAGRPAPDVLAGFGSAEAYARRFIDDADVTQALGGQRSGDLIGVVARRAHRSLVAALAGVALLMLGMAGLMAVTVAVMEIQDPVHAGLWWGPTVRFVGTIDDPAMARDLLGPWLIPAAVAVLGAAWVLGRLILLAAVRTLARAR